MRKKFLIIGLICMFISYVAYDIKPDTMYATKPYGQGIVREHNYFAQTFTTVGLICLGIWGCMKFFGGDEK